MDCGFKIDKFIMFLVQRGLFSVLGFHLDLSFLDMILFIHYGSSPIQ